MLITPERLLYMVSVAENGSFSAAGRKLGVTASAVAQVIQNMEIDLNVVLFDRVAGKAPVLTAVGKALYFQALEVAPRLQAMEKRAQAYQAGIEEKLTIATYGFTLYETHLDAIRSLIKAYPEVKLNLIDVEQTQALAPNVSGAADIIIAPAKMENRSGYETRTIDQIDWRYVAAQSHPLAKVKGELSRHDLLLHSQLIPQENEFADKWLIESLRFSTNLIECARFYQLRALLLDGLAFAMLPEPLATPLLNSGELVELSMDFDDNQTRWPIELCWTPSIGPAGQYFIEQFVEL
ncbi:LysR family transcriptional regulator [Vibrio ulleungensis]|uniref:LysR family transcriptional regulator n=1 Tax=Vibrio ulleungensis TaxID=2807619 RepID=A0ABS2HID7_9VIBR|nr:LysR family transcriptional regulator [Vibrio ulleungensis]MBM7035607.1 LysR family transcriptional regulator [Vibrio ulleungensis]